MGDRICNQEIRKHPSTKQNAEIRNREGIGARSNNLVKLIGAERVSRREFNYEGTYYVTEDGEVYDKKDAIPQEVQRTGVNFYEVTDWKYNEGKGIYEPIVRRIVIIKHREYQLSLNL